MLYSHTVPSREGFSDWIHWTPGSKPQFMDDDVVEVLVLAEGELRVREGKHLFVKCWQHDPRFIPVFAYRIAKAPPQKMTLSEIENKLGYRIQIVG